MSPGREESGSSPESDDLWIGTVSPELEPLNTEGAETGPEQEGSICGD